jgi:molybdenum storage protein
MLEQSSKADGDYLRTGKHRHVQSAFMKDSLLSEGTRRRSASAVFPLMPDVAAVQIGGRLIDEGRKTLFPILDEIRSNLPARKMVIATGSGKRTKHVLAVGEDLGLPTGILAELRRLDTELNQHIVAALLSPYGIPELNQADMIRTLPAMLKISKGAVFNGVPPYDLWEHPTSGGPEPTTNADVGVFLFALTCGMRQVIYVRDVNGIYESDPKVDPKAKLLKNATASQMSQRPDTCVDREVFALQVAARHDIRVSVVSGLKKGSISAALKGGNPGTMVTTR